MKEGEYEFLLMDRIQKIQSIDRKYNLNENAHISFSGGKDSTILHYLMDMALPGNEIPRVYINTGIEYKAIQNFVASLSEKDSRVVIVKPKTLIKPMLESEGYPMKSKFHSYILSMFQQGKHNESIDKYVEGVYGHEKACPDKLKYQFSENFKLKVSPKCCDEIKKAPLHEYEENSKRRIGITGIRQNEGGQRDYLENCIITAKNGSLQRFHPLLVVTDEWESEFIKRNNIQLCELYYPPYNFRRTGCVGCPFNRFLQKDLETLMLLLPNEWKLAEAVWKPVYEEYRRIGYRLKPVLQPKLWSLTTEEIEVD